MTKENTINTLQQFAEIDPEKVWVNVFCVGTHTANNGVSKKWSFNELEDIANEYNNSNDPAPIVIGHPKMTSPAFGWVKKLRMHGNRLQAKFHDLNQNFVEAVKSGAYKQVSVSFRPKDTNRQRLRHVGFLGGANPAIAGLGVVNFSENDEFQIFTTLEGTKTMKNKNQGQEVPKEEQNFAEQQAEIDQQKTDLAKREAELTDAENTRNQEFNERQANLEERVANAEFTAFENALKAKGIANPLGSNMTKQLLRLADGSSAEFAEGDESVSLSTALKNTLLNLPKSVDFSEQSKPENSDQQDVNTTEIIAKAQEYAEKNNVSYIQAVTAVSQQK